ncbi:MAG: PAS domain-containing protein [Candidatus Hydrogenedentes bacterium]|nr:PAS domain-containing protein [Candidatus Hydrogenedentota bacterium]
MHDLNAEIIQGLASGVIAVDRDATIITLNPAASEFLGVSVDAIRPGSNLKDIQHAEPLAALLAEIMRSGRAVSRHEITLSCPGGIVKQIGLSASLHRGQGAFDGVIVLFTDMTERLRLERSAELNRQLAALGELTAGVVHELRNPVSVISGLAELLIRKLEAGDARREAAETILRETREIERSISQFLGFARPFELQLGTCSPADIIDRTIQLCRRRAENNGVTIENQSGSHMHPMRADLYRFAQALSNIVNNAIDAAPKGGRVVLDAYEEGETTVFEIADNGPGIHLRPGEDLFAPFFTTKEGGTGLGLTIAHRIVTAHGGSVSYSNRPDRGACFVVRLARAGR